jgi:hypothetical protein
MHRSSVPAVTPHRGNVSNPVTTWRNWCYEFPNAAWLTRAFQKRLPSRDRQGVCTLKLPQFGTSRPPEGGQERSCLRRSHKPQGAKHVAKFMFHSFIDLSRAHLAPLLPAPEIILCDGLALRARASVAGCKGLVVRSHLDVTPCYLFSIFRGNKIVRGWTLVL